jgi:hypothetical protein
LRSGDVVEPVFWAVNGQQLGIVTRSLWQVAQ